MYVNVKELNDEQLYVFRSFANGMLNEVENEITKRAIEKANKIKPTKDME